MLTNLVLTFVAVAFAVLIGAALWGAVSFLASSLLRWGLAREAGREAIQAARRKAAVAAERAHPGDDLMGVADAVAEPCTELWRDDLRCWHVCNSPSKHDGDLHECRCGALTEADSAGPLASGGIVSPGQPFTLDEGETIVEPAPTYGQELAYDADGLVQYGTAMVHTRCRDARRDAATDHICEPCGKVFGRVTA